MNYKTIVSVFVVVAVIGIGVFIITKNPQSPSDDPLMNRDIAIMSTGSFLCSNGEPLDIIFTEESAIVAVRDQVIELPQVIAASGARYANADESFVLWNKGDTVMVQESGETTYDNCVMVTYDDTDLQAKANHNTARSNKSTVMGGETESPADTEQLNDTGIVDAVSIINANINTSRSNTKN
jgi:membrane-bound inhibitor of C-type lysozyme